MKTLITLLFSITVLTVQGQEIEQTIQLEVQGLEKTVEILVDIWGIPHIYAQSESDLFFAQGYYAARSVVSI